MPYIVPADLRSATLAEYASGLALTTTDVASTGSEALLTAAIVRLSQKLDDLCNDRFSTVSETSYTLEANGTDTIVLPHRTTRIYNLTTIDPDDIETLEAAGAYRLTSSLDPDGARRVREFDTLSVIPAGPGLSGTRSPWCFDKGRTVTVAADFGWTTTPGDIRRAVALLVYDHFKPVDKSLRRAERWQTESASYSQALTEPTGLPEVDDIIKEYRRDSGLGVA